MAFTPPPTAPQRGDRATFSSRVDAFLTWMVSLVGQLNQFLAQLTTLATGGSDKASYFFDSGTANSDPGLGFARFGASPQNSSTTIFLSNTGGDGINWVTLFNSLQSSTSTIKATLRATKLNDPSAFILFSVSSIANSGNYRVIQGSVIQSSSTNPFTQADTLVFQFQRTGDKGDKGDTGNVPVAQSAKFSDRKASGTGGGTPASTGASVRELNTTDYNSIPGATLSNNSIVLPPGTYDFWGRAPALGVDRHKAWLANITDSTIAINGSSAISVNNSGGNDQTDSLISGRVTITGAKSFRVNHYITVPVTSGFGVGTGVSGQMETFTEIIINKVA